jgi:hypothetical protein
MSLWVIILIFLALILVLFLLGVIPLSPIG